MIKRIIILIFLSVNFLYANENIFFIGKNLNVISVISDRPELPNRIPAQVKIIDKNSDYFKFNETISDILNDLNGFYIENINGVDRLYFRGIRNSVLFLYDGVPITSDATKNIIPSDFTVNKDLVRKFEIIYGASSVFWGPDAFGGVVNLVPDELEENKKELIINTGNKKNGFSYKKGFDFKNFYGTFGFSFENKKQTYSSNYYEAYTKFHLFKNFHFTIHLSDYYDNSKTKYKNKKWKGSYRYPFNLIKAEYLKKFSHSSVKLKSYFLDLKSKFKEDYFSWSQHSKNYYFELRFNKDLFNNNGLFTAGVSYKKIKTLNSDVIVRGFIPDYILSNEPFISPIKDRISFNSYLKSIYAQYVHNFKDFEIWTGFRYDDNSKYKDELNWNLGFAKFFKNYYFKFNYMTAFRTPIAEKFLGRINVKPEKIKMFSATNNFDFSRLNFKITFFWQKIYHRIVEDNYGGFSDEGENRVYGLENSFNINFNKNLVFFTNFTGLKSSGDKERYKILNYILIIPGEKPVENYSIKMRNFDYGAKYFGNIGFKYNYNNFSFYLKSDFLKKRKFVYFNKKNIFSKNFIYNLNFSAEYKINSKFDLIFNAKNILTNTKKIPGKYEIENRSSPVITLNLNVHF